MNRNQKIILSVAGIFMVMLILVGLTYAYFLTQIKGNTNQQTVYSKTTKLEIVYADGNGILYPAQNLVPGMDVTFFNEKGEIVNSKTFSVTNNGQDTEYAVVLENVSITYAETVENNIAGSETTFESNDFEYTLTCTSNNKNGTCYGQPREKLILENGILIGNNILKDEVHTYTLSIKYKDTNKDQSNDMNKKFSAKINIKDIKSINPYSDNMTLAYNVINNSLLEKNGTSLEARGETKIGVYSQIDEAILSVANDDYGASYYYRGNVNDNYVNFAGMCWRIVRIEGDGSVRMILEDQNTTCNSDAYTGNWVINTDVKSNVYEYINVLNETTGFFGRLTNYEENIKLTDWCINENAYDQQYENLSDGTILNEAEKQNIRNQSGRYYYADYLNLGLKAASPSLYCDGMLFSKKIGLLNAHEVTFAGVKPNNDNAHINYYLINDYQSKNNIIWLTLSPMFYTNKKEYLFATYNDGRVDSSSMVNINNTLRPVISLINGIKISSGNGTQENPYIVD